MARGAEVKPLWQQLMLNSQRGLLFICGAGFDPRALAAVDTLIMAGVHPAECRLIEYGSGSGLPAEEDVARAESHRFQLRQMFTGEVSRLYQLPPGTEKVVVREGLTSPPSLEKPRAM